MIQRSAYGPVVFLASGTRGDVQPCVAAARALQDRGIPVRIATHLEHRALVENAGIPFAALAENPSAWLAAHPTLIDAEISCAAVRATVRYLHHVRHRMARLLDSAANACVDARAVVGGLASLWAVDVAESCGIPALWLLLQPLTATRDFAISVWPWRGARLLSYALADAALWLPWRGVVNTWRRSRGLQPRGIFDGALARVHARTDAVMNAFPACLVPAPSDWPAALHPLGACLAPRATQLDQSVQRWIDGGRDVIYIGAGAGSEAHMLRALPWLHESLLRHGLRAVVNLPAVPQSFRDRMLVVRDVPHGTFFLQMRCVVHHGGAGTTAEAAHAGTPAVVLPAFADQKFWAERAHAANAAAAPASRITGRSGWLVRIDEALHDTYLRRGARACAERMRDENGAQRVAERIIAVCAG